MESTQLLTSLRAAVDASHRAVQVALRAAGMRGAGKTRCAYLGQAPPARPDAFEPDPAQWVVTPGERRSHTRVMFRWINQSINQSFNRLIDRSIDRLID